MAGAYVAKPDVVSMPDVPPGWMAPGWPPPGATDPDYPGIDPDPFFPAPYPPGYTHTLTLVMTATDTIAYDGTATVTGSARDQATYATNEPSAIRWSATIDGTTVNLRFSGDDDYSSSLSSDVAFDSYWGAESSIEFELDEDNVGDVVTLTGYYTLDGVTVSQTEDITIILEQIWTFTFSVARGVGLIPGDAVISWIKVGLEEVTVAGGITYLVGYTIVGDDAWEGNFTYTLSNPQVITATEQGVPSSIVRMYLSRGFQVGNFSVTGIFKTYLGEVLQETYSITKSHLDLGSVGDWLVFNYETGEVTIS